jgi:branched-chain amino acid aminotransferase
MAARHARDHQLDDSIVLNTAGHIADTSIANIFLVKGRKLVTPALTEGCVNGVMRRHLLENAGLKKIVPNIEERAVSIEDLLAADEVFLTNAVQGPRWVSQFRDRQYQQKKTAEIYQLYLEAM